MGEMEAGGGWGRDRMTAWRGGGAGSIGGGRAEVRGGWTKPGGAEAVVWSQGCGWGQQEDGGLAGCGNRGPDMEIPAEGVGGSGKWLYPGKTAGRVTSPGHGVDRANDPTRQKMRGA